MYVYLVSFRLSHRMVRCEVMARDEAKARRLVIENKDSKGAVDVEIESRYAEPHIIRWLPLGA